MMRSSNPVLQGNAFTSLGYSRNTSDAMTVNGTVTKTAILLLLALLSAGWTWVKFYQSGGNVSAVSGWMMFGVFGGFITAMVTVFKKEWVAITAPVYAVLEGFFIGGISSIFEAQYPGIVVQATSATFGTLAAMLFVYQSGLVKVTNSFKMGVLAATGGIAVVYFISIILSFFGIMPSFIYGSGMFGILFSVFVVIIAALNLVIDFDFIANASRQGLPKIMEWYGAFTLMVTLIWLYIEFLRLLAKMRER